MKRFLILITLLIGTVQLTTAQAQQTVSASVSQTIQAVQSGDALTVCHERLAKTLDALEQSEKVSEALKVENESRKSLSLIQSGIIAQQEKLIALLQKENRKRISFLFGLVKITY